MSSRALQSTSTYTKGNTADAKSPTPAFPKVPVKAAVPTLKTSAKICNKEMATSPVPCESRAELLGSLTTEQQQRTSARVIKKLRLDDAAADREKRDLLECDAGHKVEDKDKLNTVKQRMPKALWSIDEKNLFFEALNEYGKDFDAITSYICAKMKKKGVCASNLKTKHQVSHFYYRTWHKLAKHVHFDENVKKVAQELYALINYGELRRKLSSVTEKTCARLGEMVANGGLVVRMRGRNLRVRTPMCHALRRLNQITERSCGPRLCSRALVVLRARDAAAWWRVQAAAHNPRGASNVPLRTELATFLRALETRWQGRARGRSRSELNHFSAREGRAIAINGTEAAAHRDHAEDNLEDHLKLAPEKMIARNKKLVLHVGPRANAEIHLPTISPSEQLSNQKICFSSYLERMGSNLKDGCSPKLRTPKRQRKDSATEKDKESEQKKLKLEDVEHKLMDIDETAIDGIELMASLTESKMEEDKPSTEPEDLIEDHELIERDCERDKYMSEREKDSFSEMEDDEKYNKSDTDNESDKGDKIEKERKFKNIKVKFRIRSKKRGGSIYTLVSESPTKECQEDQGKVLEEHRKSPEEPSKGDHMDEKVVQPEFDLEFATRQVRTGWSVGDVGQLTIGDLYLMFGSRSKLELDYWWAEPSVPLPQPVTQKSKPMVVENADKQTDKERALLVEKSKTEKIKLENESVEDEKERLRESDNEILSPKNVFSHDSNDGLSGDERKGEQLASPEHKGARIESLRLADKLINRPRDTSTLHTSIMTDRLRRLLSLASSINARCGCAYACHLHRRKPPSEKQLANARSQEANAAVFRHPTPIASKPSESQDVQLRSMNLKDVPRLRRGRPRRTDSGVVVQRLLPLLPKLAPTRNSLIPVKLPTTLPKILPKPPAKSTENVSYVYVVSECAGQFFLHQGDTKLPLTPDNTDQDSLPEDCGDKSEPPPESEQKTVVESTTSAAELNAEVSNNLSGLLGSESLSLSPSRLLREGGEDGRGEGWLEGDVQDFSLSSFLAQIDQSRPQDIPIDSHLQSLMTETSIDYVAQFADLAAEVTDDIDREPVNATRT